jgi:hypothetical protein
MGFYEHGNEQLGNIIGGIYRPLSDKENPVR